MGTPSPSPELPQPQNTAAPAAPGLAGPVCAACGSEAVVNWQRRPTDGELGEFVAAETSRREQALLLADPQLPAPVFPPLPAADDTTRTVYACGVHAIAMDAASHTHASTCTAPNKAGADGCDCTPEPLPAAARATRGDEQQTASRLPAHWAPGAH